MLTNVRFGLFHPVVDSESADINIVLSVLEPFGGQGSMVFERPLYGVDVGVAPLS
mgnify:CR=1 FL=1